MQVEGGKETEKRIETEGELLEGGSGFRCLPKTQKGKTDDDQCVSPLILHLSFFLIYAVYGRIKMEAWSLLKRRREK